MKFSNLLTATLALAYGVLPAASASTQSSLSTLALNMRAHNAAINSTVASYRAQAVPLELAASYIKGNLSAAQSLADDFKATASALVSGFNLTGSTLSPGAGVPPGLYSSRALPQRAQDLFDVYSDFAYTLAPVQADPILGPLVFALEYAVLVAQAYLGIAEFLIVFAYDELFVPGGYPWGVALPY